MDTESGVGEEVAQGAKTEVQETRLAVEIDKARLEDLRARYERVMGGSMLRHVGDSVAVGSSAGAVQLELIRDFFDIIGHPEIIEQVDSEQGLSKLEPGQKRRYSSAIRGR